MCFLRRHPIGRLCLATQQAPLSHPCPGICLPTGVESPAGAFFSPSFPSLSPLSLPTHLTFTSLLQPPLPFCSLNWYLNSWEWYKAGRWGSIHSVMSLHTPVCEMCALCGFRTRSFVYMCFCICGRVSRLSYQQCGFLFILNLCIQFEITRVCLLTVCVWMIDHRWDLTCLFSSVFSPTHKHKSPLDYNKVLFCDDGNLFEWQLPWWDCLLL